MPTIVLYIFIGIVAIQVIYYLIIFRSFAFAMDPARAKEKYAVSVIVCAKNDEENVASLIPRLLEQNHPDFEIILIDNVSRDSTLTVFEEFKKKNANIQIVKVIENESFWNNKKYALTLGIKVAKKDHLLFLDADCYPTTRNWITEMSAAFIPKKTIVLGYGGYEKISLSPLNKLMRFDTLLNAIQYMSWAKSRSPFMGLSKNLAYTKEQFFKVNGFISHMRIKSGSDELFVNEVSTAQNTAIVFSYDSITRCKPKTTYNDWFIQKRVSIATASHYKFFDKFQLGMFYMSQFLFIVLSAIMLIFFPQYNNVVLPLIGGRYIISWIMIMSSAIKLKETDLIIFYPIYELINTLIQVILYIKNLYSKPIYWK